MRMDKKAILPIAGATMAAGAAIGMMMMPRKKKHTAQRAAGRAITAVGEVVEHFNGSLKRCQARAARGVARSLVTG